MRHALSALRTTTRERRLERAVDRDWRRARSQASSPSARAEIDAIFSRHLA